MSPQIASLACAALIAGLFFLNRDPSVRVSRGLWVPTLWILIVGSRPASFWLGVNYSSRSEMDALADGSPVDAMVFGLLLAAGLGVLVYRRRRTLVLLKACWPIVIYFGYCLLSLLWSDFADIAFKRWIKAIGDLVIALVVMTDSKPAAALGRLLSRVGFVLLPTSVLFIKYFEIGRGFTPDGEPMNTGVTNNKNTLGVVTFVILLGVLWHFIRLARQRGVLNRMRRLLAQGTLLAFGAAVLIMAHSATSLACFILGAMLIVATNLKPVRAWPSAVHLLVAMIFVGGALTVLFGGQASVVHALGRQTNFTGRTEIWAAVLPVVPNPILGAGFESFWLGPRLERVWQNLSQYMHVNEAHNGYIEVYLNLGWIGIGALAVIFMSAYRNAVAAFRKEPDAGSLMVAYAVTVAVYGITEAGFRLLAPSWIFFLLAVVGGPALATQGRSLRAVGARTSRLQSVPSKALLQRT